MLDVHNPVSVTQSVGLTIGRGDDGIGQLGCLCVCRAVMPHNSAVSDSETLVFETLSIREVLSRFRSVNVCGNSSKYLCP
jgi:hypothetical protein